MKRGKYPTPQTEKGVQLFCQWLATATTPNEKGEVTHPKWKGGAPIREYGNPYKSREFIKISEKIASVTNAKFTLYNNLRMLKTRPPPFIS